MMFMNSPAPANQSASPMPAEVARLVRLQKTQLDEFIGTIRAIRNGVPEHSETWKQLSKLNVDFCMILATQNEAVAVLGAATSCGHVQMEKPCDVMNLELWPGRKSAVSDGRMLAANDHSLED